MNSYKELTDWISKNSDLFKKDHYTDDDIVKLALACGFDHGAILQWATNRKFNSVS